MKIYEAADLAPDTYEGEYFQPSRETYNKAFYVLQKYREQAGDTNAE